MWFSSDYHKINCMLEVFAYVKKNLNETVILPKMETISMI